MGTNIQFYFSLCNRCVVGFFYSLVIRSFRFKLDFIIMLNALFPISNRPFNVICKCTLRTRHDARWTRVSRRNQMSNNRIVTCVSVEREREQKIKRFSFEISAPNETDKEPIHLCNEPTIEQANTRQSQTTHKNTGKCCKFCNDISRGHATDYTGTQFKSK